MSNQIPIRPLFAAIVTAIKAAWACPTLPGKPRVPTAVPYAVVDWNNTAISFSGIGASVTRPSQINTFTITGRFAYPIDPTQTLLLEMGDRGNELIAALQTSADFAGIGILPLVTNVTPADDTPDEGVYDVAVTFEVVTLADHH